MHRYLFAALLLAQQVTPQCGGAASATDQNTVALTVDVGPTGNAVNTAFVSVTICVPGQTSGCQTISGVMIDTGSSGLRVLASALTLPLTTQTIGGSPVEECFPFEDGFTWGPVAAADLTIGSKQAANVPIQLIGAARAPAPPDSCTGMAPVAEQTLDALGANGVLGIGLFKQDCGFACAIAGSSNPGLYYTCPTSGCQVTAQPVASQLQNPVSLFATDNNGIVIRLPVVSPPGIASTTGTLIFGIGTQSNNALGSANVFTVDAAGNFRTTFNTTSVTGFIDSGSNGYYFLDATSANIPTCSDNTDFYCPPSTLTLTGTNVGANGRSGAVTFGVADADRLPDVAVLPQLAGPSPGEFDWGLPFFYGRTVFTAIEGQSTPSGAGPYFAY